MTDGPIPGVQVLIERQRRQAEAIEQMGQAIARAWMPELRDLGERLSGLAEALPPR